MRAGSGGLAAIAVLPAGSRENGRETGDAARQRRLTAEAGCVSFRSERKRAGRCLAQSDCLISPTTR